MATTRLTLTDNTVTPIEADGGLNHITVYGTFSGRTVTLEYSPDDGTTWLDLDDDATFADVGAVKRKVIEVPNYPLRATMAAGGGTPEIKIAMALVPR